MNSTCDGNGCEWCGSTYSMLNPPTSGIAQFLCIEARKYNDGGGKNSPDFCKPCFVSYYSQYVTLKGEYCVRAQGVYIWRNGNIRISQSHYTLMNLISDCKSDALHNIVQKILRNGNGNRGRVDNLFQNFRANLGMHIWTLKAILHTRTKLQNFLRNSIDKSGHLERIKRVKRAIKILQQLEN